MGSSDRRNERNDQFSGTVMAGLPIRISGAADNGVIAEVTELGQLIVAPIEYSEAYNASLDADNTAYNLVKPKASMRFVVTDIVFIGTKSVSNTVDAIVDLYESDSGTSTTIDNSLIQISVPQSTPIVLTGLNLITVGTSKYINAKTSDATVTATMMGYYLGHSHTT